MHDGEEKAAPQKNKVEDANRNKEPDKQKEQENQKPKKPPIYKKHGFIPTVIIIALVLIVGAVIFWLIIRQHVSTDDAYIDGHVTQISARVAAPVVALRINDNQLVHKGEMLIELDPTTFQVALDQAKAQVSSSEAKLAQAQTQVGSAKASVIQT